jgi:hypothetical protein
MRLDPIKLHRLFKERGITHLHHANTVATALTFIEQKGLLSRGAVDKHQLFQTPQSSDREDKRFNIWNDVFLDTHDLHKHFNRQNKYGPVLFKFSIDFLLKTKSEIWVTKDNPIRWTRNMQSNDKYFSSVLRIKKEWNAHKLERRMVTIRNNSRPILFKYLQEITLDEPGLLIDDLDLFIIARRRLRKAIKTNNLDLDILTRKCNSYCFCKENYLEKKMSVKNLERLFYPHR